MMAITAASMALLCSPHCTVLPAARPPLLVSFPPHRAVANMADVPQQPVILPKFAWQVTLSGLVSAVVLQRLSTSAVPLLFALHVACMAPMLPLGISAISTVRQRLIPAAETPAGATTGWRKRRAEWLVIRHFLTSAGAFYAAGAGIVSIWLHKNSLGRAHLTSVHSWLGVATWAAWLAAYVSAQPNVWKDQWKDRRFSLWGNKRWLWASAGHRQFGTLAFASSLGAYCTGLLGWRTLDRRISIPCIGAVALIAKNVLNERSTHEAAQAMRRMVLSPVRASRALSSRVRSGPPSMMRCRRATSATARSSSASSSSSSSGSSRCLPTSGAAERISLDGRRSCSSTTRRAAPRAACRAFSSTSPSTPSRSHSFRPSSIRSAASFEVAISASWL